MGTVDRDDLLERVEWRDASATQELAAVGPRGQRFQVHVEGGYVELTTIEI